MNDSADYVRIAPGEGLPDISEYAPFRAVVVLDKQPKQEWETEATRWLVAQGCLYMMAWGDGCSRWHDSVDWAHLEAFDFGEIPDDRFIMTTWHDDEPLIDVFWYAQFSAEHGDVSLESSLVVHVGVTDRRDEFLQLWAAAPATTG